MVNDNSRPHIIIKNEPAAPVKREYNSGGGGGTYPRTSYTEHATKVYKEVDQLKAIFSNIEDKEISNLYYRVALPEGKKVETSEGKKLEENIHSSIVGSPSENVAHVSTSKSSFQDLTAQLSKYKSTDDSVGKSKFASIEEISEIPFEEKVSERFLSQFGERDDEGEALITFFPDLNEDDLNTVMEGIKGFLQEQNGEVLSYLHREEGALIKVKSKKSILEDLAKMFVSIQSLDSADELICDMASVGEPVDNTIQIIPNTSKALACIFDTGVKKDVKYLQTSIVEDICPYGDNNGVGTSHGTFVASRIIFGDSIKDQLSTGALSPDVRVLSVCTNKFDEIGNRTRPSIDELISLIRSTVEKWHTQIRVYNISFSCVPSRPDASPSIKDDVIHPLASELDTLSRKYDVLFVVCTGNVPCSDQHDFPSTPYPQYFADEENRIMSPGEAMLALTIGSIAHEEASGSMAKKNEPSPFTRRGPGFSGYHKPDLVAHGGNCGTNWSRHNFLEATGFSDDGANLAYARGTSFATPLITRLASKIFEVLPSASACLVKALLIHFSNKELSNSFVESDLDMLQGNGIPIPDMITASTKNMQTFLYQGEMDYRDMIEVPFHVPTILTNRNVNKKVRISVTISFYPETSSVLKSGYCKSHIRTKIKKLNGDGEIKDVPFSGSSTLDSDRYSTVIKMEKEFSREISAGEWRLFIAHESRWTLRTPKTKFAAVITVEDPQNDPNIDIYSAIRTEVPNKYKAELNVQERIKI